MPVITARQRVLGFIAKEPRTSASEIGRALKMSAATVRHHLSILAGDGRISAIGRRAPKGRGRPVKEYALSEKSLGDNLPMLSNVLLGSLSSPVRAGLLERSMTAMGKGLAEEMGRVDPGVVVTKRLALVVEKLNAAHYQARWEAGREGPRILFGHCPYAEIIEKHPELCRADAVLLEEEFGLAARQVSKIGAQPVGATHCIFALV